MKKTFLALAITSTFTSGVVLANTSQENVDETETMVITANRTPQNQADILSSVQVITRADIELSSSNSIAELLNEVNGIQLSQSGGAGQSTSVFSRGTNSGHTLVVIDGQRISSATLGQVSFEKLSVEQIERIEVIKGPRAALWGSDAIGGVIQIFTRQLDAGEIAIDAGLGNNKQQQLSFSGAIDHGEGATTLTASTKSSDGYDVYDLAEDDDDGYSRQNISIIGQQQLNQQWQLNWLAKYDQGESDYDNRFGGANETSFDDFQWQLSANQSNGNFYQQFFVGQQQNKNTSFGNGISEKDGSTFETERLQGTWLGNYQVTEQISTSVGVDLVNEKIDTDTAYDNNERDIYSAFTRVAYDNKQFILDGALRYDDIEGVDSEVTYNLSAGLRFAESSIVSLNVGSGFKAPSFNDLYYPNDGWSYGNPDLQAETSDSIELLLKTNVIGIETELSVYNTKIDNLIEWEPDENFAYHPVNVSKVNINGVELTLSADLLGLNHQVQLNYLDATDDVTDEPLIRRAKQSGRYQISQSWDKLSFSASVNYQGEREDSEWPSTITLPSHTVVNASALYQVADAWTLGLKVNNLFDKDYVTNNHYVGQPAQYLFTVSYRN
jgi:vitamin B12 transporter